MRADRSSSHPCRGLTVQPPTVTRGDASASASTSLLHIITARPSIEVGERLGAPIECKHLRLRIRHVRCPSCDGDISREGRNCLKGARWWPTGLCVATCQSFAFALLPSWSCLPCSLISKVPLYLAVAVGRRVARRVVMYVHRSNRSTNVHADKIGERPCLHRGRYETEFINGAKTTRG